MVTVPAPLQTPVPTVLPNGPAAAALLAAGVGSACLGLVTLCAEALPVVSQALEWSPAVGALSGKSTVAMIGWLVSWAVLHGCWRTRQLCLPSVARWLVCTLTVGLLGTFPPVFDALANLVQ
jgi:hypothetical protein